MKKPIKNYFLNEYFILILILLNALVIFIQQFGVDSLMLEILDITFTIAFVVEAILKIRTYHIRAYFSDGWNRFDFILIVLSLPSLLALFINTNIYDFSVFLALRSFRAFKAFRLIRFFPNIDHLMKSIKRALRSSYVIGLGFFILVFIVSLVSCALYKDVAPEYFHNPLQSIYAIFQLFSVEGWYEIPNLIAERSSPTAAAFAKLYFSLLLLIGGIIGLSLVNSIFVDAMVEDNNDELEEEIRVLHKKIDQLIEKLESKNDN